MPQRPPKSPASKPARAARAPPPAPARPEPAHAEELLRLCLEAGRLATFDWELDSGRLRWSDNLPELVGPVGVLETSLEQLLGWVHPEDRPRVEARLAEVARSPGPLEVDFRLGRAEAPSRELRLLARVARQAEGAPRLLGVLRDITLEKPALAEARLHAEFEEQLLGIVSHDIRSPLGAIINWSRVLVQGAGPELDLQRTGRRIAAAAVRIERLTRLLLDFTRARLGGGITLELRRCNLHELFEKVAYEFRVAYPGRQVVCEQQGEGMGQWDPDRLAQVLSNLLENALKYSPEDTPVRLVTRGEGEHVVLEVHNQGRPIPPETLAHLFEPFRPGPQASRTLKVSYGLGLYIVREIIRAHGGTIEVRSGENEGTSLYVRLPKLPPGARPGAPPAVL